MDGPHALAVRVRLPQELEGCASLYGPEHQETRTSARNLRTILLQQGDKAAADALAKRFALPDEPEAEAIS